MQFTQFQSSELAPPFLTRKGVLLTPFGSKGGDHRVSRVQAFFPVVRIESPHPFTRKAVLSPPLIQELRPQSILSVKLSFQSSELGPPHPQWSVASPPLGPRGEKHSLAGEGVRGGTQFRRRDMTLSDSGSGTLRRL
jgi:hypothetical protein